jgi:hypothetical protein
MTPRWMKPAVRMLMGALLSLAIAGCSSDQPLAPTSTNLDGSNLATPPGDQVQFAARVSTTEQSRQMLTFVGQSDTVIAAHNCQIVRLNNSQETPIPFSEIHPGDSVNVRGARQQDRLVTANRLQVCQDSAGCYDLAFRDTIVSIDYAISSFTVKGRTEVIMVDANTVIWGQITHYPNGNTLGDGTGNNHQYETYGGKWSARFDTTLALSDLTVGSVVEVKANIVDETALLALTIKLANCGQNACLEFHSDLASVDVTTKIVTFTDQPWIGWVCQGAKLTGLSGEPLTLADFAVGDRVKVKGFATAGDSLKVCQMSKETI